METAWWLVLDKDRGSRPRCVLLADGTRHDVAARLTDLVGLPDVTVSANDFWMPRGKPVWTSEGWSKRPSVEARLDRDVGFLGPEVRQQLRDWWLKVVRGANTPNWDVATTCKIEGRNGLLLMEAKAHSNELSNAGKSTPRNENGWKNHERIGSAIEQARAGLGRDVGRVMEALAGQPLSAFQSIRVVLETDRARSAGRSGLSRVPERRGHGTERRDLPV